MAAVQHCFGMIHLELEKFEEAQKHLQSSFATRKAVYGIHHKDTRQAHLLVAMAARLAGNLQHAQGILETTDDSSLGKAQLLHKSLKQIVNRLLSISIICIALICSVVVLKYGNDVFDSDSHMHYVNWFWYLKCIH